MRAEDRVPVWTTRIASPQPAELPATGTVAGTPLNDKCINAQRLSVPGFSVGFTTAATADAAPFCGVSDVAPGIWYSVIGTGSRMTASNCNEFNDYDTRISVYCGDCADLVCVAGQDDNCTAVGGGLEIVDWCSVQGREYLILVHGAPGLTGGFDLTVSSATGVCTGAVECRSLSACCVQGDCSMVPSLAGCNRAGGTWFEGADCTQVACRPVCDVVCDAASTPENEPNCGLPTDTVNGGCNLLDPLFTRIACGATTCGTAELALGAAGPTRDTDWFEFTLTQPTIVSWAVNAEFDSTAGIVETLPPGSGVCADTTGNLVPLIDGAACVPGTATVQLNPGTYWTFVGASSTNAPFPCGAEYSAKLTCTPVILGACCTDGECLGTMSKVDCANARGVWFEGGDCRDFVCPRLGACCLADGTCSTVTRARCDEAGGVPHGPGSFCIGDKDGNGTDDTCQNDSPCIDCGGFPHWMDQCFAGGDVMPTGALVGIDTDLDANCIPDTNVVLTGPVTIVRSGPLDDSSNFPGSKPLDRHLDVIDTEMVSLQLTGGGLSLTAGSGQAVAPIGPSLGAILEDVGDASLSDSFFDVFFEIDLGGGQFAYNHEPLTVKDQIDCVPPAARYIHPTGCTDLYDSPFIGAGQVVARLTAADHTTFPKCGDPAAGDCHLVNGTPYCDDLVCCRSVCELLPHCCTTGWDAECVRNAATTCPQIQACCFPDGTCAESTAADCELEGGIPDSTGANCEVAICVPVTEACCGPTGTCVDVPRAECRFNGGAPGGPRTRCAGDADGNGTDDSCELNTPCDQCGGAVHWVDQCPQGSDRIRSRALVGLDLDLDCVADVDLILRGPVTIHRGAGDALNHTIDTEIVAMQLTGGGVTMNAGGGFGGVLRRSLGAIVEQANTPALADSSFDVFVEITASQLGGPVYNQTPITVLSKIDCVPPDSSYIHITDCIPLYVSPFAGGTPVANLVKPRHVTFPKDACCLVAGDCSMLEPDRCRAAGGTPQEPGSTCATTVCPIPLESCCLVDGTCAMVPAVDCRLRNGAPGGPGSACAGDGNGNGRDDVCEMNDPCDECAPGPHWVDACPAGDDQMPSRALAGLDFDGDGVPETNLILRGPVTIRRDAGDATTHTIQTEILSMNLTGGGVTLRAGFGGGVGGVLPPTLGSIVEQSGDNTMADSFFDVFFEVTSPSLATPLYNREPLRVASKINCIPPDTTYIHVTQRIPLFDNAVVGGVPVAWLVAPNHTTFPTEACCLDSGRCADLRPQLCRLEDGTPLGPDTKCLGDADGNQVDDACEDNTQCDECGPGAHWIDTCQPGQDTVPSGAKIGIDLDLDCVADVSLVLGGPVSIRRSQPLDASVQFPNVGTLDAHLDVIDTEMVALMLSRAGVSLRAGRFGGALGVLRPSLGSMVEQPTAPEGVDSFFDVFFELTLPSGRPVYNQAAFKVLSKIDCLPPDTEYIHPTGCLPLYDTPVRGAGVKIANLVSARHGTFPKCGDASTGDCFDPGNDTPFCDDATCCDRVCAVSAFCCDGGWGPNCAGLARELCPKFGDINGDGVVDNNDWSILARCMKGPAIPADTSCLVADLNNDGFVDLRDAHLFTGAFMP